jgi:hypothetical protein
MLLTVIPDSNVTTTCRISAWAMGCGPGFTHAATTSVTVAIRLRILENVHWAPIAAPVFDR